MTIYDKIESAKKQFDLNNRILGEVLGDTEAGFGAAMRRKSLSPLKIKIIEDFIDSKENNQGIEIEKPTQEYSIGYFDKIIKNYEGLLDRFERENNRLRIDLEIERSKNNKD